jgi:hypothetical protein
MPPGPLPAGNRFQPHLLMTFRKRVAVFSTAGALLFMAEASHARELVGSGATVYSLRLDMVSAIQIAEHQVIRSAAFLHLRPGSFGVKRENIAGHTVFGHRRTWESAIRNMQRAVSPA